MTFCKLICIPVSQLCLPSSDLNKAQGEDTKSWVVTSDSVIRTNGNAEYTLDTSIQEGDVIVRDYSGKKKSGRTMTTISFIIRDSRTITWS